MHKRLLVCVCVRVFDVLLLEVTLLFWSVLSADRVEQMTKTYNDMEVVTQLLAEVGVQSLVTISFP